MLRELFTLEGPPRRSSLGRMVNQSTVLLMVSIGALIIILAVIILFHHNSNATKGYLLRQLELERSQLLNQQEVLNMQVAKAQAMEKIEQERQIQRMIPVRYPLFTSPDEPVPSDEM